MEKFSLIDTNIHEIKGLPMDPIAMISGIKTAIDLATSIKDITEDIELKLKMAELYNSIISLQNWIISIQEENHYLLQENQLIHKKLINIDRWEKEKFKYTLHEICPKVFVYASKKNDGIKEPSHWICVKC